MNLRIAMDIESIMKRDAKACSVNDTLNRAAQLMWENACGCVPVVDDAGKPIGFITDRDICMAAYTQGRPLQTISVGTSMARKVISCRTDDDVNVAIKLMSDHGVRRLPVVDEHARLQGIISLDDLAAEALHKLRGATNQDLTFRLGEAFLSLGSRRSRPGHQRAR
jgi:CBS domain-containing protein